MYTDAENSKAGNSSTYSFPKELGAELDHWVCFRASREHKFRENTQAKKNTRCFIYLPMPQNLQTAYNAGYSSADLGMAGGFTQQETEADYVAGTVDAIKGGVTQALVKSAENLIGAGAAKAFGFDALGGAVLGEGLDAGKKGLMGFLGLQLNPHKAMLFQGVEMRTHSFEYQFIPKNIDESKTLLNIVGLFKYFMTPGLKNQGRGYSGAFLEYPEQFDIDFRYGKNLFDIGQSVLTSFNVNYHSQGTPIYYDVDGEKFPGSVNMSMSFTEVSALTKKQIVEQNR
jgi:hypothetical protein